MSRPDYAPGQVQNRIDDMFVSKIKPDPEDTTGIVSDDSIDAEAGRVFALGMLVLGSLLGLAWLIVKLWP